jgi:hypothetical protein
MGEFSRPEAEGLLLGRWLSNWRSGFARLETQAEVHQGDTELDGHVATSTVKRPTIDASSFEAPNGRRPPEGLGPFGGCPNYPST